jgi:aryl-alcohol dehydrogenase-like predicted oxidoreductase
MTFGEDWGWGASKAESQKIFEAFAEAGGNFIDTANRYTEGTSEKFVGEFIASDRDHFVLSTKYTLFDRRDDPNASGNQRKNMIRSLEASLRRLKTDYVDLFWVHAWDFLTPVEEVMQGLDNLVRAGKVLYVGISDTPAWIVSQANTLADLRGWTRFVGLQTQYSLLERTPERDLLPMAHAFDMSVTTWGALGSGVLTGKYNKQAKDSDGRAAQWGAINERRLAMAQAVMDVAGEIDCSPSQVALSWVRQQSGQIIPLIGARKVAQLKDNLACLKVTLTDEQLARLDDISRIELGFPHDFLASSEVQDLIYGGTLARIDHRRS